MKKNSVTALVLGLILSVSGLTVAQNTSGNQSGTGTQSGSSTTGQSGTAGSSGGQNQRDRQTGTSDNRTSEGSQTTTGSEQTTTNRQTGGNSSDQNRSGTAAGDRQTGTAGSGTSSSQDATRAGGNTSEQSGNRSNQSGNQSTSGRSTHASASALNAQDREFVMMAAMGGMSEIEMARLALQRASNDAVKQYAQRMIDDHTRANEELMQIASAKGISLPGDMSMTGDMSTQNRAGTGGAGNQSSGQDTSAIGGTNTQTSTQGTSASSGQSASATGSTVSSTSTAAGSRSGPTMGGTRSAISPKMRSAHQKHTAHMTRLQGLSGAEFDREYMRQAGSQDHQEQLKLFQRQASRGGDSELRAFAAKTVPIIQSHLDSARNLIKTNRSGSTTSTGNSGSTTSNRSNQ